MIEYIEMKTKRDLSDTLYFTNSLCRNFPDDRINYSNIDAYFDLIRSAFTKHFSKKPEWIPLLQDVEDKFKSGNAMNAAHSVNNLIEFVNGRPY
jgi:hypothetical protein